MKKHLVMTGACLLFGIIGIIGCGSGNGVNGVKEATGLEAAIEGLKAEFDIGERTIKAFDMVGAEHGFGLIVNGEEIELYKFNPEAENARMAKETGTMQMNGWAFPAVYNENLDVVLIAHDEHPEGEKIKRVFEGIK